MIKGMFNSFRPLYGVPNFYPVPHCPWKINIIYLVCGANTQTRHFPINKIPFFT